MLVTLADMKAYLGIPTLTTTYDAFLTDQLNVISDTVEAYCGRKFLTAAYVQTIYRDDFFQMFPKEFQLFHFPLKTLTTVKLDGTTLTIANTKIRVHKETSTLVDPKQELDFQETLEVTYSAGYDQADIPRPIQSVVKSLVEERYNNKVSGVALNFGSDIQSISIPGTISVAFDYSLTKNERSNAFGTILGNYLNVLDAYRSERSIIGTGTIAYVS